jgi:recombination protein RecA
MALSAEEKAARKEARDTEKAEVKAFAAPDAKARIAAIMASTVVKGLRKEHGQDIVMGGDEAVRVKRLPTGVFALDYALGGGWPVGHVTVIWGAKSTSKTTLVFRAIAEAQRRCANCFRIYQAGKACCEAPREAVAVFVDAEGTFDPVWAEHIGVQLDKLILSTPMFGEEAVDTVDSLIRTGAVDILALDSIAMLVPADEVENSASSALVGNQPRLVGKCMRKLRAAINTMGRESGRRPTVFLINQVRHKVGVMYGSPETPSGGFAPGFVATVELKMSSASVHTEKDVPLWVDFHFRVDKNKSWVPKKEGDFRMMLQNAETRKLGDICDEADIAQNAEELGLIVKEGSSWTCLGQKFSARSKIDQLMLEDPSFKDTLRRAVLTVLLRT